MSNTNWQSLLQADGAVFENGPDSDYKIVTHFNNQDITLNTTQNNNLLCDLSHLGLLELSGADAITFLQGQVTNDVKQLNGSNAHYAGYCTPKGRLLALFLSFSHSTTQQNAHLHLQFNRQLITPILKRLKMYVMRSKVEIKDVSNDIIRLGIHGPEAASLLAAVFSNIPSQDFELSTLDNATLLKLPAIGNISRFEIFTDVTHAPALWDALKKNCKLVGKSHWDLLEIQAGIPDVSLKTQEQFVPQMLNLDLLNGINFKKGCYTGQEIVARTHYLGTVKRRTFLATIQSEVAPNEGDKLQDGVQIQDGTVNEVGQIVRVAATTDGNFAVLAELRLDAQAQNNVYWNNAKLAFKTLPYALEKA